MAPLVRFLGANGFPCGAYRPVLERLRASGLDVTTSDAWRHYTGEATWRKMADGLIEDTERQASKGRVVGVGHSFGGALLCLAAAQRPDLFERLIIVDPPMFGMPTRVAAAVTRALWPSLFHRFHPAVQGARRRRQEWATREEAGRHLFSRKLFRNFHEESHAAFLEHALLDAPGGGVTLVIPREVEAAVFETFPADVWPFSARLGQYDARTPGVVLVAAHGSQIPARELPGLRASLPSLRFATYPGGHFWALEDPEAFSKCILPLILGDVSALEDMAGAGDPSPAGKAKGSSHRAVASK